MNIRPTKVFHRLIENLHNRYLIFYGGSSSSKTISILQYLTLYALKHERSTITLSAESMPVIKKTLYKDWRNVVMQDAYRSSSFNKAEMIYTFPNKSIFQFVTGDDESRWHGMRQDIVYFDEINHIPEEVYNQAEIRTQHKIISSFNPSAKFWLSNRFNVDNTYVDHSTYKDNPFVPQTIIDSLEAKINTNPNFYAVYVEGKWGSLEGLVFEEGVNWSLCSRMPRNQHKIRIGLDFGYSIDPTAIVEIVWWNGEVYLDEITYSTGLVNSDIYNIISSFKNNKCKVIADSAEPKSIEELSRLGLDIHPAVKGKDSINSGINLMKEFKINVTSRSINLIKEFRNYTWAKDKNGNQLNKPIDDFNDLTDAIRYGLTDMMNAKIVTFI